MYGQHPNPKWTSAFAGGGGAGTLRAFAVYPAVVEPERYTNQPGYVSDTEQSSVAAVGLDLEGGKSGGGNGGDTETEEALNLDENVAVEAESVAAAQRFFSASSSSHDEEL